MKVQGTVAVLALGVVVCAYGAEERHVLFDVCCVPG
jgi:hypothetical protein